MLGRKFGRVTQSAVFYGDTDQRHRGAGKLTYASPAECHAAKLALQDARVAGHTLRVSFWSGAAKRDEGTRQQDRLAMALLGERIAHDALKCIANCDDASYCQQARQAIQAIDDLQERRAELLAVEKTANAKVAAEAAALWARNLETRKVAMECRLRKVIRQELREEMIRYLQAQSDDAPAASEASDDSDDSIYSARKVADICKVADDVAALRASEHDSPTLDLPDRSDGSSIHGGATTTGPTSDAESSFAPGKYSPIRGGAVAGAFASCSTSFSTGLTPNLDASISGSVPPASGCPAKQVIEMEVCRSS